ncbi:MAG: TSUP family transporter [Clostridia bacterium]|jgi:uncharacterized membrane protein YfcA|nr:TSUP family transporter [Clostridia bacterium]
MKKAIEKIVETAGGAVVGFVNGFFGGGGGMLLVPLLEKGLHVNTKRAHATAILLILPMCIASAVTYIVGGSMDWPSFGYVTVGVIAGGLAGALLLKKISPTLVGVIFSLLMLGVGVKLAIG